MKIGFANQKGGVGKTTLTIMFAMYLAEENYKVTCLDFDEQLSLITQYNEAFNSLTEDPPFEAYECELDEADQVLNSLKTKKSIQLFDFPGSLYNPNYQTLLDNLDLIICPFTYEKKSVDSTLTFAAILNELNIKAPIAFVPNMIQSGVRYDIKEKVDALLSEYGNITPIISYWIDMQRLQVFYSTARQKENSQECFDFINNNYLLFI